MVDHNGPNREQLRAHRTRQVALIKVLESRSIPANLAHDHFPISLICRCGMQIRSNCPRRRPKSCSARSYEVFSLFNSHRFTAVLRDMHRHAAMVRRPIFAFRHKARVSGVPTESAGTPCVASRAVENDSGRLKAFRQPD